MSLLECTPRSISPASSAASISLENSPLPPTSLSGASGSLSPEVVMVRISIRSAGTPWALASRPCTNRAWTSASAEPRLPILRNGADCKAGFSPIRESRTP